MSKASKAIKKQQAERFRFQTPHWFEMIDASAAQSIQRLENAPNLNLELLDKHRVFVRGSLDKMFWIEVPAGMDALEVQKLGSKLAEQGVDALIVSDQIRFVRLRMCSAEEEELLDAHAEEKATKIIVPRQAGAVPGPGPVDQRDGDRGGEPTREEAVVGDDQAEVEGPDAGEASDDT